MKESHAKGQILDTKVDGKDVKVGLIALPAFYGDSRGDGRGRRRGRELHRRLPEADRRVQGEGRRLP